MNKSTTSEDDRSGDTASPHSTQKNAKIECTVYAARSLNPPPRLDIQYLGGTGSFSSSSASLPLPTVPEAVRLSAPPAKGAVLEDCRRSMRLLTLDPRRLPLKLPVTANENMQTVSGVEAFNKRHAAVYPLHWILLNSRCQDRQSRTKYLLFIP